MSIIIDLIILGIIMLCVFLGIKRGLAGSILKIISLILAIVIAAVLYKPVAGFLKEKTTIDDSIRDSIVTTLDSNMGEDNQIKEENTNLPNTMVDYINQTMKDLNVTVQEEKTKAVAAVANNITETIMNAIAAVSIFIIARILLFVVSIFLNVLTELPLIKQVDKAGGIIYGLVEGLIIIWALISVLTFLSPLIASTGVIEAIHKSFLGGLLYNNNILLNWIF